jgi:hypothetical protein
MRFATALTTLLASRSYNTVSVSSLQRLLLPHRSHRTAAMSTASFAVSEASRENLIACPTITLSDGTLHPAIGFGTYKVGFIPASASAVVGSAGGSQTPERTAQECISDALDCGYRFLECAEFYGNEAEVGKAIAASGIDRKDLFLCSKVWTTTIEKGPDAVRAQLEKTLEDLGTRYIDLYCKYPRM